MRGTNPNLMGQAGQTDSVIIADGVVLAERLVPRQVDWSTSTRIAEPEGRRYLPTLADLIDRLSIVQLKAIFISERSEEYRKERADIEHDIDLIIKEKNIQFDASAIHAIIVLAISNRFIWENESKARAGGSDQDKLLKLTHSINGVRNTAKNQVAVVDGGRLDYKIDSLAADLPMEFGNWRIFE